MKLRQYERKEICDKAISKAYKEKISQHQSRQTEMFVKAWEHLIPAEDRRLLSKIDRKYLRMSSQLVLNIQGMRIWLSHQAPQTGRSVEVPMPYGLGDSGMTGPIAEEILAWYVKLDEMKTEQDSTRRKLMAMLESVTTIGKLQEVWPEGEEFYRHLIGTQETGTKSGLPAPLMTELNEKLGLTLPKTTKKGKTNV